MLTTYVQTEYPELFDHFNVLFKVEEEYQSLSPKMAVMLFLVSMEFDTEIQNCVESFGYPLHYPKFCRTASYYQTKEFHTNFLQALSRFRRSLFKGHLPSCKCFADEIVFYWCAVDAFDDDRKYKLWSTLVIKANDGT